MAWFSRTIPASEWGLLYYNGLRHTNANFSGKKIFIHKSSKSRQPYIGLILLFNDAGGSWESEPVIITEHIIPSESRGHGDTEEETEDLFRKHTSISIVLCSFWYSQAVRSGYAVPPFCMAMGMQGHLLTWREVVGWILKLKKYLSCSDHMPQSTLHDVSPARSRFKPYSPRKLNGLIQDYKMKYSSWSMYVTKP